MGGETWRGLERPGEGEFVILDGASCGAASLAPADGSSWICTWELFLSSECHSGTWFMSSGNSPPLGPDVGGVVGGG